MAKKEKSILNKVVTIIFFIVLFTYSLTMIFPLVWGFMTSLKSDVDFQLYSGVLGLPQKQYSYEELFKLSNYVKVFEEMKFTKDLYYYSWFSGEELVAHETENNLFVMLINTILLCVTSAGLGALVPAIMAYVCAKYKFKFSGFIYAYVVTTMTIPIVGSTPSVIKLMQNLGIFDTWIGWIVSNFSFGGMYFLVFYGMFEAMPNSYAEAAEIDGANQYHILFKIMLPLQIKVISTVFLIKFVELWNNYQSPMISMPTHPTLAYGVYRLINEVKVGGFAEPPGKLAACMMLAVPILIVFVVFKDKIMGDVTVGAIKG